MKYENDKIGIGIIGAGVIAAFHAKAISEIKNARLAGIYSRTRSKTTALASQYDCVSYETLDQMLNDDHVQLVCICTPSGLHLEPALACINAGKHCLIEKPLEITTKRCDEIIHAAKQKNVYVGVIFQSRFHDAEQHMKRVIENKKLGDIVLGDAYVKWNRTPEYYQSSPWRGTQKYDGGGALMNQGIHSVDLLQWFMGPVQSVMAYSTRVKHKTIEVEDTVVASLKFVNGALGVIECSTAVFPAKERRIEIRGTDGGIVLEGDRIAEFELRNPDDETAFVKVSKPDSVSAGASDPKDISYVGHQRQIEDMIHAIQHGNTPVITAEEGRKSVRIVEAIYESALKDKEIIID